MKRRNTRKGVKNEVAISPLSSQVCTCYKLKRYMIVFVICIASAFSFNSSLLNFDSKETIQADSILFPEIKHREQTKLINQLLTRYHYKKISLDDSLSVKILNNYIKSLDPNREYFYGADIKYFNQHKYEIDKVII